MTENISGTQTMKPTTTAMPRTQGEVLAQLRELKNPDYTEDFVAALIVEYITEAVEEERRKLTHPKLVDDDGPLQVLVDLAREHGHNETDPGGCEYCHAVELAEEYLRHPTEPRGDSK